MKNIIVVGASSGIGKSLTNKLLDTGHSAYAKYFKNKIEKIHPNLTASYFDLELTETFEFELQSNLTILTKCNLSHKTF